MALVKTKPTSPGRRFVVKVVNKDLHKGEPWAGLVEKNPKRAGAIIPVELPHVIAGWSQATLSYYRF